ncbi:NAD(P)/FAD-dependent oxidoreductase [Prosthecochloris sp. HL-130-GSB]|jgi:pyruvate/2-oxoglutarate dehydrogenase complex dihydrolipoamide dehydrogenase (E3) component|uniref:dihydrolipoyl dehydrogenase family protein n=1 Tax=Prosthecochloris sp. HL-130-GSB TaxID=1974213 RepID=UPI000A1C184E|nr:NAD(P)/FAD-dependent oxidoreductase [Prosthecochloris sp. HL-130-GSB]ARM30851.1 mercuric reductase [Prosthecochloris sp. HL-130-GSB]MBO8093696.1 NAD(P)/FAD-dependent oxidoreductase [Prosthecochloris sp.]
MKEYDVIVIGAGAAGLTAAGVSASLGAKTAMIEARKNGGDCTWYGCIPSKTLIHAATTAWQARKAKSFGINIPEISVDFPALMKHIRNVQEHIYNEADAPAVYEQMGVEVIPGRASFIDEHTISIAGEQDQPLTARAKFFVIATGSQPAVPPIEGLRDIDFLTNETLFSLAEQPRSLLVLGAGPVGIEMGQAFCRLGSKVTVIDAADRILPKDHPELTSQLREHLEEEGMIFHLGQKVTGAIEQNGKITLTLSGDPKEAVRTIHGDALLVAAGRKARFRELNLEAAGVKTGDNGIIVNQSCQTSRSHIYACGDVTGQMQFTHAAEHMAKIAVSSMLTRLPMKTDLAHMPWCTYTDPEMAHVGATEEELRKNRTGYEVYRFPFSRIDRAITDSRTHGWVRIYAAGFDGRIYGADILGAHAGDMISEIALAMRHGITLRQVSDTIHPYPTYALGNRRAADQWYVQKQSGPLVGLLQFFFGYQGKPQDHDPDRII